MKRTAYNGRYLMMGFASNKVVADEPFIVPRRIALGNFKLCGVLLAYAQPDDGRHAEDRRWAGTSRRPSSATEIMRRDRGRWCSPEKIKPVIGQVVDFDEIPAAIEAMANRRTVGRTIVMLDA